MPDYAVFILRFMLFAAIHSVLAMPATRRRLTELAGWLAPVYRLVYNALSLLLLIWVMGAFRHSPVLYYAPGLWSLAMYLVQLLLLALLLLCLKQTGASDFLGIAQLKGRQEEHGLVTNGFYGVVRHPLYLLSLLFFLFNPVMTVQWLLLTGMSTLYFFVGALLEEKRLVETYGEAYRCYRGRVPFIMPALTLNRRVQQGDKRFEGIYRDMRDHGGRSDNAGGPNR